ncbi:MAG: molecular chaperone HtpG [bacterium]|nr:molecular chaperone HtpG [bacterium]
MTSSDEQSETNNETINETSYEFQAEVARLLELMVHSVYSEREVFLRELISNSADALDKLRYKALTDETMMPDDLKLAITLVADKETKTLTIIDNGIGMSKSELVENLGTIARSGTKAFIDQIKQGDDSNKASPDLIGQFGVGFYAAFMVADRVDVISRRAGSDESFQWTSDGKGMFDITALEQEQAFGTSITLHLKDDAVEFLEESEIQRIVHTYSDHISFPIFLKGEEKAPTDNDEKSETEDAQQQLNAANALWTRSKNDITPEQYKEFYHHTASAFDDPALTIHYTAEGRQLYTSLLFVPSMPPFDLYDAQRSAHIKLFVKRIFITDDAEILPPYLRFVRGIVDSEDIPLNLSREMLQNNPLLASIRKAVTNKVLSELTKLADNEAEKYLQVWEHFGAVMKEGLYEDVERRDTLYKLTRFKSTLNELDTRVESDKSDDTGWRSLDDYIKDMPEGQTAIYYLAGDNMDQLKASPQLEGYMARGLEVLLLADPVDSFWVSTAAGFEGKPFTSITQGSAALDDLPVQEGDETEKSDDSDSDALLDRMKTALVEDVADVQKSSRLVASPACLIASAQAPDRQLEKMLAQQKGGSIPSVKPILEINASHAMVKALNSAIIDNKEKRFSDLAFLLLDEARILEGNAPKDPAKFTERLNRLLLEG